MQVSSQSQMQGPQRIQKKHAHKPKQNDNQQPPIGLQQPQGAQNTQGLNNRLNVTA